MAVKSTVKFITAADIHKAIEIGNEEGLAAIGHNLVTQVKDLTRVVTGRAKNGHMWKTQHQTGGFNDSGGERADREISVKPGKGSGYAGNAVYYDWWLEWGTRKMHPRPHWRPAIALVVHGKNMNDVLDAINEEVARGTLKKGRKHVRFY